MLSVLFFDFRPRLGVHCLSSCGCHDACSSAVGSFLLHHDHLAGARQSGAPAVLYNFQLGVQCHAKRNLHWCRSQSLLLLHAFRQFSESLCKVLKISSLWCQINLCNLDMISHLFKYVWHSSPAWVSFTLANHSYASMQFDVTIKCSKVSLFNT